MIGSVDSMKIALYFVFKLDGGEEVGEGKTIYSCYNIELGTFMHECHGKIGLGFL